MVEHGPENPRVVSSILTVGTRLPGTRQHVHMDWAVAAGWPPIITVALPLVTRPISVVATRNRSLGWRPTWGGVFMPDEPATAAGLLPIITVVARPWSNGAEKGKGGGRPPGPPDERVY